MKILILGSTGFVGHNLCDCLAPHFTVIRVSRNPSEGSYAYFDLTNRDTWNMVVQLSPDVIINASAYGVIKHEQDVETMYAVNYLQVSEFYNFLIANRSNAFWLQVGTAFEYDLTKNGGITEQTASLPRTHYGISKLMFSRFLFEKAAAGHYSVFRPFGMFGRHEDESKFFPMLIKAQQNKQSVKLSAGTQERDYFFIDDLCEFVKSFLLNSTFKQLPVLVNLGRGKVLSLKEYAFLLSEGLSSFDPSLWHWSEVDFRANESSSFFNSSLLAEKLGFKVGDLKEAFAETITHYQNNELRKENTNN